MSTVFDINQRPPFLDPMETLGIQPYDVLKIKNVPFAVSVPEIKSFVNRLTSSPLIKDHQQGYPVHIIMERPTGKTMDCFVEFQCQGASRAAVSRAEQIIFEGKALKMGARHIEVEASSEGELCAALFPRAKSVLWNPKTGVPDVVVNEDPYSEGFQGFLTIEEITSVCKHAANPQKCTFSQRCQQRVYESMISTLYKFPWHVPKHYSVNTRNFLWSAYVEMLNSLIARVQPSHIRPSYAPVEREVGLNHTLLMEFLFAGLNVQTFSLRQKGVIAHASGSLGPGFSLPRQASGWPFQSLLPPSHYSPDVLDEWLNILDAGYEQVERDGNGYRYDNHMKISRDEAGFLRVELNDAGRALPFSNLISMEKGLMEFLVEQGRILWCQAYGVPYKPADFSIPVSGDNCLSTTFQSLELSYPDPRYPGHSSCSLGSRARNDQGLKSFVDTTGSFLKPLGDGAYNDFLSAESTARHFNPKTPPFVPSQPWIGSDVSSSRSSKQGTNLRKQPNMGSCDLPLTLGPSWTSPDQLPASRTSDFNRAAVSIPSTPHELQDDQNLFDPFNNNSTTQGRYGISFPGRHQSAPGFSDVSNEISNNGRVAGSLGYTQSSEQTSLGPSLSHWPGRSNIWVPQTAHSLSTLMTTNSPKTRSSTSGDFGSMRGSPSGKAGIANIAMSPCASASGIPSKPKSRTFGSPVRNARSRSSTGHDTLFIQPTIHEEEDANASETIDRIDEPATEGGGVNIGPHQ